MATLQSKIGTAPDRRKFTTASGSVTSLNVDYPLGGSNGDFVYVVGFWQDGSITPTPSAGWTTVMSIDVTNPAVGSPAMRAGVWYGTRSATPLTLSWASATVSVTMSAISLPATDMNLTSDSAANTTEKIFPVGAGWDPLRSYIFTMIGWTFPSGQNMALTPAGLIIMSGTGTRAGFQTVGFNDDNGITSDVRMFSNGTQASVRAWVALDFIWRDQPWTVGRVAWGTRGAWH